MGIAKPSPPGPIRKFTVAAVVTPTTCPAPFTSGPPESPARTGAANSISPVISSELPVSSSLALMVRPKRGHGAGLVGQGLPVPRALPSATTGSPDRELAESPSGAAGSPPAPRSWSTAMSCLRS